MMRAVTSFVQMKRMTGDAVTGVGRHAIAMLQGLKQEPSIDLEMAAARDDIEACQSSMPAGLQSVKIRELPFARGRLEMMWKVFGRPYVDRWLNAPDWIYTPAESFVPTKRAKVAVTIHDLHAYEPDLPWSNTRAHLLFSLRFRLMLAKIVRRADVLLTVSEFSRQRIQHFLKVDPDKIVVVGNGVDIQRFTPLPKWQCENFVLVVGGLTARKGGRYVLEMAALLKEMCPQVILKVGGRCDAEFLPAAQSATNVELLGYVHDDELPLLYGRAAALYFPALYEGFGIPVIEALACGIPVVTSDQPAVVEAGNGAAIIQPANAVMEAASALMRIINDEGFAAEQRKRALNVREKLSWDQCIQRLVHVFDHR